MIKSRTLSAGPYILSMKSFVSSICFLNFNCVCFDSADNNMRCFHLGTISYITKSQGVKYTARIKKKDTTPLQQCFYDISTVTFSFNISCYCCFLCHWLFRGEGSFEWGERMSQMGAFFYQQLCRWRRRRPCTCVVNTNWNFIKKNTHTQELQLLCVYFFQLNGVVHDLGCLNRPIVHLMKQTQTNKSSKKGCSSCLLCFPRPRQTSHPVLPMATYLNHASQPVHVPACLLFASLCLQDLLRKWLHHGGPSRPLPQPHQGRAGLQQNSQTVPGGDFR